ncbi:Protein of unknown function [Cotesia congregata]|uniref:Lipocalin/cytosolic fatty-acid binding domain-containing protein n=1 Tax=Cotesia congregata TaxID=51543 RepID=A0A8J2MTQ5_COTCN|nr:Protein of unknown function [Cotesia congregata]
MYSCTDNESRGGRKSESRINLKHQNFSGGDNTTLIGKVFTNDRNLGITFQLPVLGLLYREYWVLETDYDNYCICWICEDRGSFYMTYKNL